jgi:ubiquinone/menaquinone biosynthesis C-methylase UbiE
MFDNHCTGLWEGQKGGSLMTERSTPQPEAAARLLELIQMRLISGAIHVVAALGVADLLADGPKSSDELANATGASAQPLRRVMRALAGFGVFSQDSAERFKLAPLGEFLRRDTTGSMHHAALFYGDDVGPNVIQLFLESVKKGESAVHRLAGGRDPFEWLQSDPERTKLFNSVMNSFSILHITGLMEAYDFSPAKKIVDVGGGHGKIISEILRQNPSMRGVLFDLPHAFEGGKKAIAQAGLVDRCEVISGDFFVSVPAGADSYILSRVIHDWDDQKTIAILKAVRRAIVSGGKLILLETLVRSDGATVYPLLSDLNMLLITGGSERTEEEYRLLYRAAGFELTKTVATKSPTGTTVIEGKPI